MKTQKITMRIWDLMTVMDQKSEMHQSLREHHRITRSMYPYGDSVIDLHARSETARSAITQTAPLAARAGRPSSHQTTVCTALWASRCTAQSMYRVANHITGGIGYHRY